jgi:glycosyltransferase involved in cell wall biosynthesis
MSQKIVYYIDSDNFGGAEQVLYTLLKRLDRDMWHPVLIYHPSTGILPFIELAEKLQVETLPVPEIRGYLDVMGLLRFVSKLRAVRPAIFHANINWPLSCSYGIIAAYLARIHTIIATQHLYQEIRSRRQQILQRFISMLVDCYIAISTDLANQLKKAISPEKKIRVVQNGIDLEYYSGGVNDDINRDVFASFKKNNAHIVLTVARLAKQKGHTYLLKAATKIPEAVFIFAGDGPERPELEKEARELNVSDRVVFLGERNDIPSLLSACDVYVQPSIFEGGLALSIMEAMAACKPVIATDVEGVRSNVTNGENILIVPPADPEALIRAISTLLSDKLLANRISTSGKSLVYRIFSAQTMINELTKIYINLIDEQNKVQEVTS